METEPPLLSFFIEPGIILILEWSIIYYLIGLALLLMCSGLFSGSEVAVFSLTPGDIEEIKEDKSNAAKTLIWFRGHQKRLLALLLICNTFVNIGIAILTEKTLAIALQLESFYGWANFIQRVFQLNSITLDQISYACYFIVAVLGSTSLILLFGEIMPKIYGRLNSRKLSLFMAIPLRALDFIFWPLTWLLVNMTHKVEKRLLEKKVGMQTTTKEDLDAAIDLAINSDQESGKQVDILKGIIKFNDVSAKQVMTPRTELYALNFSSTFKTILETVRESGFSRLPVYNEDFDQITGILYVKDLIAHLDKDDNFEWQTLIRTNTLYVPESRKINELLNDFQEKHVHMSFVVDEYGGINGIVTLEDIMEEIVGEIQDEFDEHHELNFVRLDPNNYLFDGKTLINDMCRVLGLDVYLFDEARGNADSIAGLLLENNGEMPRKDQELLIENYKFKVVSVTKRRIEQIKVTI